MNNFHVYIIQSQRDANHFYTGYTENIEQRLSEHNSGKCVYTLRHQPWKFKTVLSFSNKQKALAFEKYLKTQSGRAFAKKRL